MNIEQPTGEIGDRSELAGSHMPGDTPSARSNGSQIEARHGKRRLARFGGHGWIALAFLLPLSFVIYEPVALTNNLSQPGLLDATSFILLVALVALAFCRSKITWLRYSMLGLTSLFLSIIFVGNTIFFRVFHDWIHYDIILQWRAGPSVLGDVIRNLGLWDWYVGVMLPLALSGVLASNRRTFLDRKIFAGAVFLLLILAFSHHKLSSLSFEYSEHNVAMNFSREWLRHAFSKPDMSLQRDVNVWDYYPRPFLPYDIDTSSTYPLLKVPTEGAALEPIIAAGEAQLPNIVVVLMETIRALESGAYGADMSLTPELDKLAEDGLLFSNFYANGRQTVRGEMALLCSFYPSFAGPPLYINKADRRLSSLPGILKEHGYKTLWISSYTKTFHNKVGFLSTHGIDEMHDGSDLPPDVATIGWGPTDEVLFSYAERILDVQPQPFFAEIMTLSNHWPFTGPFPTAEQTPGAFEDPTYSGYTRGVYYTDWAIGKFMERMRQKPYFENTIFVFVGDHGTWLYPEDSDLTMIQKQEAYFRMPLIIYAPKLLEPAVSEVVASQVDFAPTMLHMLGIRGRNSFVGRSLLASPSGMERYAFTTRGGQWNLRVGDNYIYDFGRHLVTEDLLRRRKGYKDPKPKRHDYLITDKDLLRVRDTSTIRFGSEEAREDYVKWAKTLIGLNQSLLEKDRIFDHFYGVAAPSPAAASALDRPAGEPNAADDLEASARAAR